jgi:hypothetical protein
MSCFLKQPGEIHGEAALDILKYLKGSKFRGIQLGSSSSDSITCYTDSDFANDLDDRKSVTGGLILRGTSPLSWTSKKQKVISTSTAEAECNATYINCLQLITIRDLISELELCLNDEEISTSICIDNQPLLDMIQNGRVKNKQLDIKILKLVEWRSKNQFIYQKVCTKSNLADIFTKALAKPIFKAFTEQFMVDLQ